MKHLGFSMLFLHAGIAQGHEPAAPEPKGSGMKVLVYSNTGYYRHPDTPKINRWLVLLGHENGFEVDVTEHWKDMRAEELSRYDVLVLNNANELDKVLPEQQRKTVEEWFTKGGKGIVGLHAALVHQMSGPGCMPSEAATSTATPTSAEPRSGLTPLPGTIRRSKISLRSFGSKPTGPTTTGPSADCPVSTS